MAALAPLPGKVLAAATVACLVPSFCQALEGGVLELWSSDGEVRFTLDTCATTAAFRLAATDADTAMAYDLLLSTLLARGRVRVFDVQGGLIAYCPQRDTTIGSVRALS